jgi:L,D-transpeptidase YcbB
MNQILGAFVLILLSIIQSSAQRIEEPKNSYYLRLKECYTQYFAIKKNGGFPKTKVYAKQYAIGDSNVNIKAIKQYLCLTKDLLINDSNLYFTAELSNAIKHFQLRMGLEANGNLDVATAREINISINVRIKQIAINLERLRFIPSILESNYVLINIPEFKLHIIESSEPIYSANVVVGKAATQTEIFKNSISKIILNPYWNIPYSIIKQTILPQIKKDKNYLVSNNMEILSNSPLTIRQKPGVNNALGKVKFFFPNKHNIYLHDSPAKELFKSSKRAFSHGCIRLENPKYLATYLLKSDTVWNIAKMDSVLSSNVETAIDLFPKIPIYIVYFTVWVNDKGKLNFRKDIYGLDKKPIKKVI